MKGGYKLIDLSGVNLSTSAPATVSGIYETIEGNYRKRVVLSNLVIGNTELPEIGIAPMVSGDTFIFSVYGYNFTVADDDSVTLSSGIAVNVPDSTAEDVAGLVTNFNSLLSALKDAGIMTPDAETKKGEKKK